MKNIFELVARLARGKGVWAVSIAGLFAAVSAQGTAYNIEIGTGTAPFQYRNPTTTYQVDPTGIQNQQGVHGFVTHHNGVDTYVNVPGENYYITFLHVNDSGNVSGTINVSYGGYGCHSIFWASGQPIDFSYPTWSDAHVIDMNNLGEVVGSFGYYGSRQGFIYDHGNYTTFNLTDQLHGHFDYNGQSYRINGESTMIDAVNDYGQILGNFGLISGGSSFWFIASPIGMIPEPGTMTLLGLGFAGWLVMKKKSRLSRQK
jgi:PEP-CTERM motif